MSENEQADAAPDSNDFNAQVIKEFRENGGKVGGMFEGAPMMLLTTTGARSGQPRIAPLVYTTDDGRFLIIASKGGAPTNPDWFHNILAHPEVTVEVGTESFPARASVPEGTERDRLFNQMAGQMPGFADYQKNTSRQSPVVLLARV